MSEVKLFSPPSQVWMDCDENGGYVLKPDFDRVTAERDAALGLSVAKIMLDIVPGYDGMGEEVYARSVEDVEHAFTKLYDKLERLTDQRNALQQRLTAADERADALERDKARIDWLADQPVDTLYLDDGRIIDVAGRVDLRDAIDAAMAAPAPSDDDDQLDHADANEPPCSACFARGCNGECMENL